jgi:hypothetical protein
VRAAKPRIATDEAAALIDAIEVTTANLHDVAP